MQGPQEREVVELELDHQELFRKLADLRASLRAGIRSEVAETLRFVRRYADTHFAREERAMLSVGYPLFHVHRAAHGRLGREVRALEAEWARNGLTPVLADSVLEALSEWFELHIMELDAQLMRFLRSAPSHGPVQEPMPGPAAGRPASDPRAGPSRAPTPG